MIGQTRVMYGPRMDSDHNKRVPYRKEGFLSGNKRRRAGQAEPRMPDTQLFLTSVYIPYGHGLKGREPQKSSNKILVTERIRGLANTFLPMTPNQAPKRKRLML